MRGGWCSSKHKDKPEDKDKGARGALERSKRVATPFTQAQEATLWDGNTAGGGHPLYVCSIIPNNTCITGVYIFGRKPCLFEESAV